MSLIEAPRTRTPMVLPRLQQPKSDAIAGALQRAGCVVVERVLPEARLNTIARALDPWFERACRSEGRFFGRSTKRFSGLFAKAPETAELAIHPEILAAVETVLLGVPEAPHGDCIQLNLTQAIEIAPGEGAQLLHRDDNLFPIPKTHELMVNVMWAIDPFAALNGATRLTPGSHRWPREEDAPEMDGVVSAEAPAGSAIIWVGSLLHGGGANWSAAPRRGVVMSYSLAWLAQAEKLLLSIPPEAAARLPERLQRLIGYQIHRPNLGWVEGRDPHDWLTGDIGELASARDNLTPGQQTMLDAYFSSTVTQ